jgi:hypothetical protein
VEISALYYIIVGGRRKCYNDPERFKMRSRIISVLFLLICVMLLSGCRTTLVVHDTTAKAVIPVFKDYVGMHGYAITFANEKTGSYHVNMGSVFMPYVSSTQKSKSTIQYYGTNQPLTAYEETSWNSVANPAHYENVTAAVSITQKDKDVQMIIDIENANGPSLNDIKDYLKSLGFEVESK